MTKEIQEKRDPSLEKRVRVTLELPNSFIRLLNAKAHLQGWTKWSPSNHAGDELPPEMDAGAIIAWLVLQEARGITEAQIHASTPMMWRTCEGPEVIHEERRVYEGQNIIAGPHLVPGAVAVGGVAP